LTNCPGLRAPREPDLGEQAQVLDDFQRHRILTKDADSAGLGSVFLIWVHRAPLLGEGSSLVMSDAVEAAMAEKTNLFRMATGSNLGGTVRLATYGGVTLPFKR